MTTRRLSRLLVIALLMVLGLHGTAAAAPPNYLYEFRAAHSDKCLDVRGASLDDQALVQQYGCTSGLNQRWWVTEQSDRSTIIRAAHSGKCLDVQGASLANQALVQQFTCHGGLNQRWWIYFNNDGTTTIISVLSGKCLDIRDASLADRAVAQQFTCRGTTNQRFKPTLLGTF